MIRTLALLAALATASCFTTRYVGQAAFGQLELWTEARSIAEVIADPETDDRTRVLLQEVGHIRRFARAHGLSPGGSYTEFVDLDRNQVVWFVTASKPLAFEPKLWSFPIVGSFPYLGWFDTRAALAFRQQLRDEGWDVYVRPVRAYSTGGWFDDPVLSTMLLDHDGALRYLANVMLHELVHANVLVNDQSTFNESVASFIGDHMAEDYLVARFGADSEQVALYRQELAEDKARGARLTEVYAALDAVYKTDASPADKRAAKRRIIDEVVAEMSFDTRPNNASLIGFKTYNAGLAELGQLHAACGNSWPRTIAAVKTFDTAAFGKAQQEDIGPTIANVATQGCPAK